VRALLALRARALQETPTATAAATVTDLGDALGVAEGSVVHRCLGELVDAGLVQCGPDLRFRYAPATPPLDEATTVLAAFAEAAPRALTRAVMVRPRARRSTRHRRTDDVLRWS
jgi:DNA-binding IclR family transcriptional regulator